MALRAGPLLLVVALLAGCLAPAAPPGAGPAPEGAPALPADLAMQGAQVLARDPTRVTFRWQGTVAPGALGAPEPTRVAFPVPDGMQFEVRTATTWEGGASLFVFVQDAQGQDRCVGWRQVRAPFVLCSVPRAGPASGPWSVLFLPDENLEQALPVTLDLTLRSLLPRPLASLQQPLPFEAQAGDGVALRGHVYLPEGAGPFAAVLAYSPYWNEGGDGPSEGKLVELDGRRSLWYWLQPFADAGYAVALVNLRGTGLSDGCYSYMNHPANGPDAAAVIEALAAQPWSTGAVGMVGISYLAAVQDAVMASGAPAALKAAIPISGEIDEWNLLGRNGAAPLYAAAHPSRRGLEQGAGLGDPFSSGAPRPEAVHGCPGSVEGIANYQQLAWNGDKDAWLQARDLREGLRGTTVPVLRTSGLTDGEGHRMQFDGWWDLMAGPKRLVVGQFDHNFPDAMRADWWQEALDWLDHHLRGAPARVPEGVAMWQDDAFRWHNSTAWPPPGNRSVLHLTERSMVLDPAEVKASQQAWLDAPDFPGPDGACEGTKAAWVSPPLAEDVVLAGSFELNLSLLSTAPNGNLAAVLYRTDDPAPCPASGTRIAYAISDLRHRGHLAQGQDFPVGTPAPVALHSDPFAASVPKGSRLLLFLGSPGADWAPRGQPLLLAPMGSGTPATLELVAAEGTLRFAA